MKIFMDLVGKRIFQELWANFRNSASKICFFTKTPLASEMAWGEGTLKKCESPEDERYHPQRKGDEALMNYIDVGKRNFQME